MRLLVYLVAISVDGFVAGPGGEFDFFPADPATFADLFEEYPETCPAHAREALGVTATPRHFDTVVMGARTHQPALDAGLTSAYPHLRQYVVTHRQLPDDSTVTRVAGDPLQMVRALKREDGLDIWLCGGGNLAAQLLPEIDELHLKINPVLTGDGTRLVDAGFAPQLLSLTTSRTLSGGVVLSTFKRL